MSNSKAFREKKEIAFEAYLGGKTTPKELAEQVGCSTVTISKWIKNGKWDTLQREESNLLRDISVARKRALITALNEYAKKPQDTALQSLVSLIRQEQRKDEPSKELNEYIIRFLDQATDFMIEKGHDSLLRQFQGIVVDLAEYLRLRNA